MGLLGLPVEIILLIVSHLDYEYEVNALCRTTRRLHELLNPILYKRSVSHRKGGYTLEWAADHGSVSTCRLILGAGAPPDACGSKSWQPFALAALGGHNEILEMLFEHGVDPSSTETDWENHLDDWGGFRRSSGMNPLSLAASHGQTHTIKQLLRYGVPPDLTDDSVQQTALHVAALRGFDDIVGILIDSGCSVNAQDAQGLTALACAALGHLDIVQLLLSRGADPNIVSENMETSLCMASLSGNIDIVRCLLDHGATISPSHPDGLKPLLQLAYTAKEGYDDIVELLLTRFDYVKSSTEPYQQAVLLCVAALTGRTALLTDLLSKYNFDPNLRITDQRILRSSHPRYPSQFGNSMPKTAIDCAAERNELAAIAILLSHGASINPHLNDTLSQDRSPLLRAISNGHKEAVAVLLEHGANPNEPPGRALVAALQHPPVVSLLLSHGADPMANLEDSTGHNVISSAIESGAVDALHILLDPETTKKLADGLASMGQPEKVSVAVLMDAVKGGEKTVQFLLDRGILIMPKEVPENAAEACLDIAAQDGGIPLMRLLLDLGLDVHAGNNAGKLLQWASMRDEELLDFLLENGCSIDDPTSQGETALVLAVRHQDTDGVQLLLDRKADPLLVCANGKTALSAAVKEHDSWTVELLLQVFEEKGHGFGVCEVERVLKWAETYELLERDNVNHWRDIVRVLRRYYWRTRYPVCP
ncbi:uncharacterized protein DSM5745_01827 [Aspergillus mulundensis]|uniref:F-box domain-containing protein n=1 Tax=Aspergillus mulundensis TaxID=1810919 RepID=A0A3D8SUQ3_9EURO|nr:hypothetical protein DSM5745_01827 [Aspergillus mulundensis]RDW90052.1 hypothetical protein DSM5745_01827 [Aspergillus mulundensis]